MSERGVTRRNNNGYKDERFLFYERDKSSRQKFDKW